MQSPWSEFEVGRRSARARPSDAGTSLLWRRRLLVASARVDGDVERGGVEGPEEEREPLHTSHSGAGFTPPALAALLEGNCTLPEGSKSHRGDFGVHVVHGVA